MAAVNSRDKNQLEKRSSRRAWCTFGRHFLSSASACCSVAHVRLLWRRCCRLFAVGKNFLFSSLAWQLGFPAKRCIYTCITAESWAFSLVTRKCAMGLSDRRGREGVKPFWNALRLEKNCELMRCSLRCFVNLWQTAFPRDKDLW